jgi:hypothetical protein
MKIVIYSPSLEPEALADALSALGHELLFAIPTRFDGPELTPVAMLAAHLLHAEEALAEDTDAVVFGADADSDFAFAAALVADKLQLPSIRLVGEGDEDRLLSLVVPESITSSDPAVAASEIAAWAEALPTLPAR